MHWPFNFCAVLFTRYVQCVTRKAAEFQTISSYCSRSVPSNTWTFAIPQLYAVRTLRQEGCRDEAFGEKSGQNSAFPVSCRIPSSQQPVVQVQIFRHRRDGVDGSFAAVA